MKKRTSSSAKKKKPSAADLLASPPPTASPNTASPPQFDFNISAAFNSKPSPHLNNHPSGVSAASPPPPPPQQNQMKSMSTIGDLKEMASSRLDSIKRHLDRSHSEIAKDIDASHSRLYKRFKIQTQACQQVMDEADKEYKKMSERIIESKESLKASYSEFMAEAHASASRVCKSSIPELSQSFDKALDVLRGRYGATTAI